MGSIVSSIDDIINEYGSWEAYVEFMRSRPVVACVGLPVMYKGDRYLIEQIHSGGTITLRSFRVNERSIATIINNLTTGYGAEVKLLEAIVFEVF